MHQLEQKFKIVDTYTPVFDQVKDFQFQSLVNKVDRKMSVLTIALVNTLQIDMTFVQTTVESVKVQGDQLDS